MATVTIIITFPYIFQAKSLLGFCFCFHAFSSTQSTLRISSPAPRCSPASNSLGLIAPWGTGCCMLYSLCPHRQCRSPSESSTTPCSYCCACFANWPAIPVVAKCWSRPPSPRLLASGALSSLRSFERVPSLTRAATQFRMIAVPTT